MGGITNKRPRDTHVVLRVADKPAHADKPMHAEPGGGQASAHGQASARGARWPMRPLAWGRRRGSLLRRRGVEELEVEEQQSTAGDWCDWVGNESEGTTSRRRGGGEGESGDRCHCGSGRRAKY